MRFVWCHVLQSYHYLAGDFISFSPLAVIFVRVETFHSVVTSTLFSWKSLGILLMMIPVLNDERSHCFHVIFGYQSLSYKLLYLQAMKTMMMTMVCTWWWWWDHAYRVDCIVLCQVISIRQEMEGKELFFAWNDTQREPRSRQSISWKNGVTFLVFRVECF